MLLFFGLGDPAPPVETSAAQFGLLALGPITTLSLN